MKSLLLSASALIALSAPLASQAVVYTFNANLKASNELHASTSTATGLATLSYDTKNTPSLADDTYDFALSAFGLEGGPAGKAASAYHIHGAASATETATVRVALDAAPPPFFALNSGTVLLVGAAGVPAPSIPATAASGTNMGYPAMSFLDMLRGGLAYVNVHTTLNPAGAIRGQLIEVSAVPEPSTYALLLGGLGVVGFVASRRRRQV